MKMTVPADERVRRLRDFFSPSLFVPYSGKLFGTLLFLCLVLRLPYYPSSWASDSAPSTIVSIRLSLSASFFVWPVKDPLVQYSKIQWSIVFQIQSSRLIKCAKSATLFLFLPEVRKLSDPIDIQSNIRDSSSNSDRSSLTSYIIGTLGLDWNGNKFEYQKVLFIFVLLL